MTPREQWVADVADHETLVRLIRAALTRGVTEVVLPGAELGPGPYTLQVRLHGKPMVVLAGRRSGATAATSGGGGGSSSIALRLSPLDPSHVPELIAMAEIAHEYGDGDDDAATATASDELETHAHRPFAKTLTDADADAIDLDDLDDLEGSGSYDPEAALVRKAPPRPNGTEREDTLTIPSRPSMVPRTATGAKAAPPTAAPLRAEATTRIRAPESQHVIAHPADSESYSVVFGTEPTSPGVPAPSGPRLDDIVDDDAATYPRESRRAAESTSNVVSSGRGPRTQRRTGNNEVVVAGRIIANRYRIDALVGAGGVGAVYKATHTDLPRTFAIKVLHPHYRADPHALASFRTEARAASSLDHPNVTVVHDFGEEPDGLVYIVMEFLPGVNLQAVLDLEITLAPARAIDIMLQVCAALSAAHDRGIVHRDVKPDNIVLVPSRDDEGRPCELVKVCDFGIAALDTAPDARDPEWTAGTPEYMAPEQALGRADARTDVYACGIVLYEMVTGRPPFLGDSPSAVLAKAANEAPRRPSDLAPGLPRPLENVIMRAIEKSPARRFASMRDLRAELRQLRPRV